ncbi:AAA family ATPase [Roseateles sp. BYS87W]|uniref:AAA family ATPase n=1 Tax=Pelomonas baiyunensis TaxID=3299026 RepID=A0ABW7H2C4_9BURK
MTLEEYTQADSQAGFTGWVKFKTDGLGWRPKGGSSFDRVGVCALPADPKWRAKVIDSFSERPHSAVDAERGYCWRRTLGADIDAAFRATRLRIVEIAEAAQGGNLNVLKAPQLHADYEWKVFFLYQDRDHPVLLPAQEQSDVRQWYHARYRERLPMGGGKSAEASVLANQRLMDQRSGQSLFDYVDELTGETYGPDDDTTESLSPQTPEASFDAVRTVMPALNQILYGPPGTGKTYETIDTALAILDPAYLAQQRADRSALKARFDTLVQERRVRFVTFHQSFSYEDFVEGIRASTPEGAAGGGLTYAVERGVFGELCADASRNRESDERIGVGSSPTVWKLSIAEASSKDGTRQYCFEHDEARIGWKDIGDLELANLANPSMALGAKDRASLQNFAHEIQVGDVVLCLGSKTTVRAVGVVAGPYEYQPEVPTGVRSDYVHRRAVRWLNTKLDFDITSLNGGKQLTLQTVYPLSRIEWPQLEPALRAVGALPDVAPAGPGAEKQPYVLIIDEINRGNISRIFGELITLIEPSKRAGAEEALEVVLPYSKMPFSVPSNVYLIGTMNTADRSLTGLDVALRRRFEFREMPPRPGELKGINVEGIEVDRLLDTMNQRIEALLDRDHRLGHAYFMPLREQRTLARLEQVFRNQVLPLLQEYFFDDWQRIQWVLNDHRKAEDFRFVRAVAADVAELFGLDVNVTRNAQTWSINELAFKQAQSYLGVIDHRDAQDAAA